MKIEIEEKTKIMYCPKCKLEMEYYSDTGDWRYDEMWICNNTDCTISRIAIG